MIDPVIASLPQGAVIDPADAERWLTGIAKWHSDRTAFHLRRLRGIGGSESGAVARGVNGKPVHGFSNLEKVVQQKLLKRLPEWQNNHMERGAVLEELARLTFMYRYKAAQDTQALSAIERAAANERFPWLVGNPDDINIVGGRRLLNDYKVQSSFSDTIDEDHIYQLHHYGLQARFASVPIDGYLLTKLDLAPELADSLVSRFPGMDEDERHQLAKTIAMADVPGMRVVSFGVEVDRNISLDILDTCSYAWQEYVLRGIVPTQEAKPLIELDELDIRQLEGLQHQFLMAKGGITHLESVLTTVQGKLSGLLADADLEKVSMPLSAVNIKGKGFDNSLVVNEALALGATQEQLQSDTPAYSVVALIDEIKKLNGDPEADHLKDMKSDPKKAQDYLVAAGIDLSKFRQGGLSILLSRKKADKEALQTAEAEAGAVLGQWFDNHLDDHTPLDDGLELIQSIEQVGNEDASGTTHGHDTGSDVGEENPNPRNSSASMR